MALLGLFLGVNLDLHSYWNSPLKPSFSFCPVESPPDGKSQAEEKQVSALLQHLLLLSNLRFVAVVVVFADLLLCFCTVAFVLPNSHLFPFHPLFHLEWDDISWFLHISPQIVFCQIFVCTICKVRQVKSHSYHLLNDVTKACFPFKITMSFICRRSV